MPDQTETTKDALLAQMEIHLAGYKLDLQRANHWDGPWRQRNRLDPFKHGFADRIEERTGLRIRHKRVAPYDDAQMPAYRAGSQAADVELAKRATTQTTDPDDDAPVNPEIWGKLMKADDRDGWVDWENEDFEQWAISTMSRYVTTMDLLTDWIVELEDLKDRIQETHRGADDHGVTDVNTESRTTSTVDSPMAREWLVIEDSRKHAVFAPEDASKVRGYIPRDVAERLLGRDLGRTVWFTAEDSAAMRAHPEWRTDL